MSRSKPAARPKSESGFYEVELNRSHEYLGFTYGPGPHTVNEDLLTILVAEEGLVANVGPAS